MRLISFVAFCAAATPLIFATEQPREKLQGNWIVVAYDQNGHAAPAEIVAKMKLTIKNDQLTIQPRVVAQYKPDFSNNKKIEVAFGVDGGQTEASFKLEPEKGRIDLAWKGARNETKTTKGLYLLDDDALKICFAMENKNRPKKFPEAPKAGLVRIILKRDIQ
jgi:uncharacterized protein (TIGR03067 family)